MPDSRQRSVNVTSAVDPMEVIQRYEEQFYGRRIAFDTSSRNWGYSYFDPSGDTTTSTVSDKTSELNELARFAQERTRGVGLRLEYDGERKRLALKSHYAINDSAVKLLFVYDEASNTMYAPRKRAAHLKPVLEEIAEQEGWEFKTTSRLPEFTQVIPINYYPWQLGDDTALFSQIAERSSSFYDNMEEDECEHWGCDCEDEEEPEELPF